jgi:tetratricopeptide (TPR) repeat protein
MRPYQFLAIACLLGFTALLTGFAADDSSVNSSSPPAKTAASASAAKPLGSKLSTADPDTAAGFSHLYNLQYDKAITAFDRTFKRYPTDPFALNHLLQAILLKEMYRLNALDTTLYADNGFLAGKPLAGDPQVKARILELADEGVRLANERLKQDPNDVDALYARGVSRGLRLSYLAIVEKSFLAALRNVNASRSDHEKVLQLDPGYTDAKLIVGMHNYVIGSLPLAARILVGVIGVSGNKKKGLEYLKEVAASKSETSIDARVTLALFLRRDGQYDQAWEVMRTLVTQFPHNFIFALEEANLLKDAGHGPEAVAAYTKVLRAAAEGSYAEPHLERAEFGLAESLRGQHKPEDALAAYQLALATAPDLQPEIKVRSLLGEGLMNDALKHRDAAVKDYEAVLAFDPNSPQAAAAKKWLKQPYSYP